MSFSGYVFSEKITYATSATRGQSIQKCILQLGVGFRCLSCGHFQPLTNDASVQNRSNSVWCVLVNLEQQIAVTSFLATLKVVGFVVRPKQIAIQEKSSFQQLSQSNCPGTFLVRTLSTQHLVSSMRCTKAYRRVYNWI